MREAFTALMARRRAERKARDAALPLPNSQRIADLEAKIHGMRRGYLVLIVAIVLALGGVYKVSHRQGADADNACRIQSKGLEAQKHLARVMIDIDVFLEPPSRAYAKAHHVALATPIPQQPYYGPALKDLRFHLPAYNRLERQQPARRSC